MTKPEALIELAERLEAASGPDREIDRDIALRLGLYDRPEDLGCFEDPAEAVVGGGGRTYAPPAFTASLDAAMTLVPDGWAWSVGRIGSPETHRCNAWTLPPPYSAGVNHRTGATGPLALAAACLRALAQGEG